jgi:hypothetical protein
MENVKCEHVANREDTFYIFHHQFSIIWTRKTTEALRSLPIAIGRNTKIEK